LMMTSAMTSAIAPAMTSAMSLAMTSAMSLAMTSLPTSYKRYREMSDISRNEWVIDE
jgi:hypothetical protein